MNKTDLIFYLSTAAGFLTLFAKITVGLIPTMVALWVGVAATLVAFLAYAFYEHFNGTTPPPTPPTTP